MGISSYGKIYNLGHSAIAELFFDDVAVEEKVDGSQFSFGVYGGEPRCRSKGKEQDLFAPDKMFEEATQVVLSLAPTLVDGWTYRAEYLKKPKHNTLTYDRTPGRHLALFDVDIGIESYLGYEQKAEEAGRLGLDVVPLLHHGRIENPEQLLSLMDRESFLGGPKIEGMVFKNYRRFGADKKALMGKHVSEDFKEVHRKSWKTSNPSGKDILQVLSTSYRAEARWVKAVHRLRDEGRLTNTPRDIGLLIKETQSDIMAECEPEIRDELFKWAKGHVSRGCVAGLAEWYKKRLAESQFGGDQ